MGYIDCDTHVYESDATWDHLDPKDRQYRPKTLVDPETGLETWVISDQRHARMDHHVPLDKESTEKYETWYPPSATDLSDVPARLAHMDRLGVDVQIVFSTFFNTANFGRPSIEAALVRSWNRWMAERTALSDGRLRWSVRAPLRVMDRAIEELEFGKEHGATGVHLRGVPLGLVLDDDYFDPFFAKAQDLDLVINVHAGLDIEQLHLDHRGTLPGLTNVILAFHRLAVGNLAERFPRLRWAFVEAGAAWLPFALEQVARATETMARRVDENTEIERGLLERKNLYVTCAISNDLPYILGYAGESNLVVGSDYGHFDIGSDLLAPQIVASRGDIPTEVAKKIVDDNGRRLHGIDPSFTPAPMGLLTESH